jgi:hypothetical protein
VLPTCNGNITPEAGQLSASRDSFILISAPCRKHPPQYPHIRAAPDQKVTHNFTRRISVTYRQQPPPRPTRLGLRWPSRRAPTRPRTPPVGECSPSITRAASRARSTSGEFRQTWARRAVRARARLRAAEPPARRPRRCAPAIRRNLASLRGNLALAEHLG